MMTPISERDEQRKALNELANAGAQLNQPPRGNALVRPTTFLADQVIGAQVVAVLRDESRVLQKLVAHAAAAGSDWFYRFPVRRKDGGQDWIEGPSIKLALDVARIYGNCIIRPREVDVGDAWVFYARFDDVESGFSLERAYRQRKSQVSIKTKDADRQQDAAYQIGQSKALRNVIVNALQSYCDFAFDEARNSLVEKIGKDINTWRQRTLDSLARMKIDVARVERAIGRPSGNWLAADIARVVAQGRAISDGMATADETFPPLEPASKPAEAAATPEPAAEALRSNTAAAEEGRP
jgi:hypothetical protein